MITCAAESHAVAAGMLRRCDLAGKTTNQRAAPHGAGCMMPDVTSPAGGSQDDLGARLLAAHPRGEQWCQLDVTVANLTVDQLHWMNRFADADTRRDQVRAEVIDALGEGELLGRLGSRWIRWASTFGLPAPADVHGVPREILRYPYQLGKDTELPGAYLSGVWAVFDAGLGIAAAPCDEAGAAAYELLTGPWRRACLPSRFTADSAYGPRTQQALAVLRRARSLPARRLRALCRSRAAMAQEWALARDEVDDKALAWGYPWRSRCLFWEAVPAAEDAANESPTNPYLADALWGAAATQAFTGQLSITTTTVLASPWRAAGLTLPL